MRKYYRVLEIPDDSPLPAVKQAYRDLVRVWHPDRFVRDERLQRLATEKLMQINEAYRFLCSYPLQNDQPDIDDNPISAAAEPIDWSMVATPQPAEATIITNGKSVKMQWYYSVVGIPLVGLLVLLISGSLFDKSYKADTLPPPLYQRSGIDVDHSLPSDEARSLSDSAGMNDPVKREMPSTPLTSTTDGKGSLHRFITIGSTKDEVWLIQGVPTELNEKVWRYGKSLIHFDKDRVIGWSESDTNPLIIATERRSIN